MLGAEIWKRLFRQPLPLPHLSFPLPPTKNEKTTVDRLQFFNFCGSVACLLLHFIVLRRQTLAYIAITLPTTLSLLFRNTLCFSFLDIRTRVEYRLQCSSTFLSTQNS